MTTTFRARLLQAILVVVATTTVASLVIAQRQSSASFQTVVDELFRHQTRSFQREQEARIATAVRDAEHLAMSVRLFAALEANDSEVYKIAADELRLGGFSFFRLLNAQGEVIATPPDGRAGLIDANSVRGSMLPQNVTGPMHDAELGFIEVVKDDPEAGRVYRVLASPITNFDSRVGTLIVGQRMERLASDRDDATGLHSAVWVDGKLIGSDIPSALAPTLLRSLTTQHSARDGELTAHGEGYRFHRFRLNDGSSYPPAELVSVFSLGEFQSQQRSLALRLALLGAAVFGFAALLATAFARQLARPIAALVDATKRIRNGDYDLRLAAASTREVNTLAEAFNDMAAGLSLKDRYFTLLKQVTDPEVAEELVAGRVKLGGEQRDMTVMFCDIRGYVSLTVGRNPEEVIRILNRHTSAMTQIVQAHRGVINQFAGDAIMILFGAPKSYGDDTERAVRCACAMMTERHRMNQSDAVPLEIGIGLASGSMVAGCIGAENRSDYTAVGERANLAARLCAYAAPGQIILDEETFSRVHGSYVTTPLPPLNLKGFSQPVTAYGVAVDIDGVAPRATRS